MTQTKFNSFLEACESALIAAPSAIILHKYLLVYAGNNALNGNQNAFVTLSWIIFLFHSIIWRYTVRRLNEKYNIDIRPLHLIRKLRKQK